MMKIVGKIKMEKLKQLRVVIFFIGLYIIADGIGSIMMYPTQPMIPDHMVRVFRMIVGGLIIMFNEMIVTVLIKKR